MGNLFYRGVSTVEIKAMDYRELRYWNKWHKLIADGYVSAAQKAREGSGK